MAGKKKPMNAKQRAAYVKEYRKARKTKEGGKGALFGGSVAHKRAKSAASKAGKKKKK